MSVIKTLLILSLVAAAFSSPVNSTVAANADSDEFDDDPLGYFAEQASAFLDDILKEDHVKVYINLCSNYECY